MKELLDANATPVEQLFKAQMEAEGVKLDPEILYCVQMARWGLRNLEMPKVWAPEMDQVREELEWAQYLIVSKNPAKALRQAQAVLVGNPKKLTDWSKDDPLQNAMWILERLRDRVKELTTPVYLD